MVGPSMDQIEFESESNPIKFQSDNMFYSNPKIRNVMDRVLLFFLFKKKAKQKPCLIFLKKKKTLFKAKRGINTKTIFSPTILRALFRWN